MKSIYQTALMAVAGILFLFPSPTTAQHVHTQSGKALLESIRETVLTRSATDEEALVTGFRMVFNPGKLQKPVSSELTAHLFHRCGTELVKTFYQNKAVIQTEVREEIESYLQGNPEKVAAVYTSPSKRFKVTYSTSGTNAVPAGDTDSNGIPDFVEKVALYFDLSWDKEVTELGFAAPPATEANPYNISFEAMSGIYGYTEPASGTNGTHIVMHRNFSGFPANDDPEGDVLGAAKVTAAHEFKHALQYISAGWNGESSNWLEMDATWTEDIVFDYVNDYYNYLDGSGSLFKSPATSLNPGSYEDCTFSHYFTESISDQYWVQVWEAIEANNSLTMVQAMTNVLTGYGKNFNDEFLKAYSWHAASGTKARAGFGFGEAGSYPVIAATKTFSSGVVSGTQSGTSLVSLSANYIVIKPAALPANDSLTFDGSDNSKLGLSILVYLTDNSLVVKNVSLDPATNKGFIVIPQPDATIQEVVLVVTNSGTASATFKYGPGVQANYLRYGDLNKSGTVTSADVPGVLKSVVGSIPAYTGDNLIIADVSGNGKVTSLDAAYILQKAAGILSFFPADINQDGFGPEASGSKIQSGEEIPVKLLQTENGIELRTVGKPEILSADIRVNGTLEDLKKLSSFFTSEPGGLFEGEIRTTGTLNELKLSLVKPATGEVGLVARFSGTAKNFRDLVFTVSVNEAPEEQVILAKQASAESEISTFSLSANYPNPFNPTTAFQLALPVKSVVEYRILNILGQDVTPMVSGSMTNGSQFEAGIHTLTIKAETLPTGVYFYSVKAGNTLFTGKMTLLK